ncbi:MAG: organic solvent tolerance protein OstA [Xanthobacteraceae bacterium]|jgi:lipopolysaccharide export system protein LptA|nr:organic solvent tolerance protein OstA [Xanthobacteraceae bacterium]
MLRTACLALVALPLVLALVPGEAAAQGRTVPNALEGFSKNRNEPIKIDANSLEVRDKDKAAVFSGNVIVQQGDTTLRCKELVVFYDGKGAAKPAPGDAGKSNADSLASGGPISSSAIRRLEINGGVIVNTKEQTATGEQAIFETASNTITLTGKPVVLTSGPNVIRGQKLTVDLVSGTSRFEGGRVESLIVPGSAKQFAAPKPGEGASKPAASKPAAPKPPTQ